MNLPRISLTLFTAAGGLLAAALLPSAAAFADDTWVLTPEPASFVPEQADGYPPLIDVVTGTETWDVNDVTAKFDFGGFLKGTDTHTTFGSITNDDLIVPSTITFTDASGQLILTQGT
jgi:hypothetical protein